MRVLVIGGTRFIGPHVVRQLHRMGHDVALFHRGLTETELPADVIHVHGDQQNLEDFVAQFRQLAPDVVLNMVLYGEPDARAFVTAFLGIARRIVAISSEDVYRAYGRLWRTEPGPPDPVPLTEDSPLRERLYPHRGTFDWGQDYEKILVERVVMGNPALPGTILRLPMVYGPIDGHRIFPYLKRMDDERPAILLRDSQARWRWSRGYVENVAEAIALAIVDDRAAGRIYNVAEPEALTEKEWVRKIANAVGWNGPVISVPKHDLPGNFDLDYEQHWVVDTSRIRTELGYAESVSRDEALLRTVAWERAHPPEQIDPTDFDYAAEDAALAKTR